MTDQRIERAREVLAGLPHQEQCNFLSRALADCDCDRPIRAMLAFSDQERQTASAGEEYERGRDDGATFVIENLAKLLGADDWTYCDGTEEWEGDVTGTVQNVLIAAHVLDDYDGAVARHATAPTPSTDHDALVERITDDILDVQVAYRSDGVACIDPDSARETALHILSALRTGGKALIAGSSTPPANAELVERLEAIRDALREAWDALDDSEDRREEGIFSIPVSNIDALNAALERVCDLIPDDEYPADPGHLATLLIAALRSTPSSASVAREG